MGKRDGASDESPEARGSLEVPQRFDNIMMGSTMWAVWNVLGALNTNGVHEFRCADALAEHATGNHANGRGISTYQSTA